MRKFRGKRKHRNKGNAQAQSSGGAAAKMAETENQSQSNATGSELSADVDLDLTIEEKVKDSGSGNEGHKKLTHQSSSSSSSSSSPSSTKSSRSSGRRKNEKASTSTTNSNSPSPANVRKVDNDLNVVDNKDEENKENFNDNDAKEKERLNEADSLFNDVEGNMPEGKSSAESGPVNNHANSTDLKNNRIDDGDSVIDPRDNHSDDNSATITERELNTNIVDDNGNDDDEETCEKRNSIDIDNFDNLHITDDDLDDDDDIICPTDTKTNEKDETTINDKTKERVDDLDDVFIENHFPDKEENNIETIKPDDGLDTNLETFKDIGCEHKRESNEHSNILNDEGNGGDIKLSHNIADGETASREDKDNHPLQTDNEIDKVREDRRDNGVDNDGNGYNLAKNVHAPGQTGVEMAYVTLQDVAIDTILCSNLDSSEKEIRERSSSSSSPLNDNSGGVSDIQKDGNEEVVDDVVNSVTSNAKSDADLHNENGAKEENGVQSECSHGVVNDVELDENNEARSGDENEQIQDEKHDKSPDDAEDSGTENNVQDSSSLTDCTEMCEHSLYTISEESSRDEISEDITPGEDHNSATLISKNQPHSKGSSNLTDPSNSAVNLQFEQTDLKETEESSNLLKNGVEVPLDSLLRADDSSSEKHLMHSECQSPGNTTCEEWINSPDSDKHQETPDNCNETENLQITDINNPKDTLPDDRSLLQKPEGEQISSETPEAQITSEPTETTPITSSPLKTTPASDAMNYESLQQQQQQQQKQQEAEHREEREQLQQQVQQLQQQLKQQQEAMTKLQAHAHAQQVQANTSTTSLRTKLRRKDQELKALKVNQENHISVIISHLFYLEGQMQKEHKIISDALNEKEDVIRRQRAAIEDLSHKNSKLLQALKESHGYAATENGISKSAKPQVVMQNGNFSIQDHGNKVVLRGHKEKGGEKDKEKRSSTGQKVRFSGMKERLRRHKSSLELYQSEPLEPVVEGKLRYFGSEENLLDTDRPSLYRKRIGSDGDDRKQRYGSLVDFPDDLREVDESVHDSPDSCFGEESNSLENISGSDSYIYSTSLLNGDGRLNNSSSSSQSSNSYGFNELSKSKSVPQSLPTVTESDGTASSGGGGGGGGSGGSGSLKERPHSLPSVENLSQESTKVNMYPNVIPVTTPSSESNPFKSFKNVFKRRGSKKKRSVSLGQTVNKEYQDAMKQHFKKYDLT